MLAQLREPLLAALFFASSRARQAVSRTSHSPWNMESRATSGCGIAMLLGILAGASVSIFEVGEPAEPRLSFASVSPFAGLPASSLRGAHGPGISAARAGTAAARTSATLCSLRGLFKL